MTAGAPPPRPSTARLSAPPLSAMRDRPRPRIVIVSFWLWFAGAALAVVAVTLAVTRLAEMHAEFVSEARANDPTATADTIENVADLSVLVVVGGGVLLGVAGVLFAAAMRGGRRWARPTLVLVVVLAAGWAVLVVEPVGPLVVACAAVLLVAAVCMYLPGSKSWFV